MRARLETRTRPTPPPMGGRRARGSVRSDPDDYLYARVARALREEIVSGVYPVGSRLPNEEDLCERFSVSRYTVREALRRLREDSLVSSRKGAGTIVVAPRLSDADGHHLMSINNLVDSARGMRFALESIKMVAIDERVASRTGLESGSEWLEACGFGFTEGVAVPTCWAEYYINRTFAAVGRLLQRHTGPVFPLIEDLFGQRIVEVEQEIGAVLISAERAGDLEVEPGTAALEVRRTYKLASGEVAQATLSTHPASRFRHSMTMRRVKG